MEQDEDPYHILGVSRNASAAHIKKEYRKLALKYHPDKTDADDKASHDMFAKVSAAHELLSDEEKRRQYDLHQELGGKGFDPNKSYEKRPQKQRNPSKTNHSDPSYTTKASSQQQTKTTCCKPAYTYTTNEPTWTSTPTYARANSKNVKVVRQPNTQNCKTSSTKSNSASNGVQSMSTNTRAVKNPDGRTELITETTTTYFDGRIEKKSESTFSSPIPSPSNKTKYNGGNNKSVTTPNGHGIPVHMVSNRMIRAKTPTPRSKTPTQSRTPARSKTPARPRPTSASSNQVVSSTTSSSARGPQRTVYRRTVKSSGY